jgi:hypothetical protein
VTQFQVRNSANWYAARVMEALVIVISIAVAIYVVKGCWRARRILTFDLMFCLAGATMFWGNFGSNFFQPTFLMSSNFVNLTNTCGHMPFVVNPDCGRAPDAFLFLFLLETFGILGVAIAATPILRWARSRWPGVSTRRMVAGALVGGILLDIALEIPCVALHLWTYPAPSWMSLPLGGGFHYPFVESLAAGLWFGSLIALRLFKDDQGHTLVERNLEAHSVRRRPGISLLATYSFFQLAIWIFASVPLWFYGPYESPWPKLPAYVVNNVCDAPGVHTTRYGPCPGSPGYRMPGRHSLPGTSP